MPEQEGGAFLALVGFLLLAVLLQALPWRRPPQVFLYHTPTGQFLLRLLPWQAMRRAAPRLGAFYGRGTARDPMRSLVCGAAVVMCGCSGMAFWLRLEPAAALDPWALLDMRDSPVARRQQHTRAAFGAPSDALIVLASACDARRSVCEGSMLQPLLQLHNLIVGISGEADDEGAGGGGGGGGGDPLGEPNGVRGYAKVCHKRIAKPRSSAQAAAVSAASATLPIAHARCAADSILTLANPSALDASARLDSTSHLWTPGATSGATSHPMQSLPPLNLVEGGRGAEPSPTQSVTAEAPYEALVRRLVAPALHARGGTFPPPLSAPYGSASRTSSSSTFLKPISTSTTAPTTSAQRPLAGTPTPLFMGNTGGATGGAFASNFVVGVAHTLIGTMREGLTILSGASSAAANAPPSWLVDDQRRAFEAGLHSHPLPMGPPESVAAVSVLVGLRPPPPGVSAPLFASGSLSRFELSVPPGNAVMGAGARVDGRLPVWSSSNGKLLLSPSRPGDVTSGAGHAADQAVAAAQEAARRWDAAARSALRRRNEDSARRVRRSQDRSGRLEAAAGLQGLQDGSDSASLPECLQVAWDSFGTRTSDMRMMIALLCVGSAIWLALVIGVASVHLSRLAPLLRHPVSHAAVAIGCSVVASLCGLGFAGWLASVGWPSAEWSVGIGCGPGAAGGLGCLHAYALLTPFAVLPPTLDAAFVLAHSVELSWRQHEADVSEERFAHAAIGAMPRLLAAATAAIGTPLCGALAASHLGSASLLPSAPVLQLAASVGFGVLCAHLLVLSLFWGGMLFELRGEVRVLLRATADPPDVALAKTVHATLRRERTTAALALLTLMALLASGLAAAAGGPPSPRPCAASCPCGAPRTRCTRGSPPPTARAQRSHATCRWR